jgi:hypothetical protein
MLSRPAPARRDGAQIGGGRSAARLKTRINIKGSNDARRSDVLGAPPKNGLQILWGGWSCLAVS